MKQIYDFNIKEIENLSLEEKTFRQKNLDLFYKSGFPSKQAEDWKFTDLNSILNKNFQSISNEVNYESDNNFEAPYKLIGLAALSVESAITFFTLFCRQALYIFSAPITLVLINSDGLYSAAGTCFNAAA